MDDTTSSAAATDGRCRWCGNHHGVQCPEVKALEFHPDGSVKRVEFRTAQDYQHLDWKIDTGNIAYAGNGYFPW